MTESRIQERETKASLADGQSQDGSAGRTRPILSVLMTCFNRREETLACLRSLRPAIGDTAQYSVYLVDDGSSDGTGDAVASGFPDVNVIHGPGDLYWNGGMRLAWTKALESSPDFYLWLNDDMTLEPGSIAGMLRTYEELQAEHDGKLIVVGRTIDPDTGETSYGGYRRARRFTRLNWSHLAEDSGYCDTMNGNCVLIPAAAASSVGINSRFYSQQWGDTDYGIRAVKKGYAIFQHGEPVAKTDFNDAYHHLSPRLRDRNLRYILFHPKGIPVVEWFHFCRQNGGPLWPINFVYRYWKLLRRPS